MISLRAYLPDQKGSAAAEFALVLPVMLLFAFGAIEFGMLMFTSTQLHWTTEDAARCASVKLDCRVGGVVNNAAITNYAATRYKGLAAATFTPAFNGPCAKSGTNDVGYTVAGAASFKLNLGVYYRTINMASTSCFP